MKKTFLLCFILLCSTLTLAATTSTPPETTDTKDKILVNTDTAMESVEKNIDRRLVYLNRYKRDDDMESLAKLVSEGNKDFYINFMKYVKSSPLFTVRRDTNEKIVKTPIDEYVISAIMSVDKKETKVSITFTEEKTAQGTKWLISDSNLHIQVALPTTTKGDNLASNALNTPTKTTPTSTTKPKTPVATTTAPSKSIVTVPVVNKTPETPNPKTTTNTPVQKSVSKGLGVITISIIAVCIALSVLCLVFWILMLIDCIHRDFEKKTLWIILFIFLGTPTSIAYYFLIKRKNNSKALPIVATVATTTAVTALSETPLSPVEETKIDPALPTLSNVTVSTVEDIHTETPEPIMNEENTITPETPIIGAQEEVIVPEETAPTTIEETEPTTNNTSSPTTEEIEANPTEPLELISPPASPKIIEDSAVDTQDVSEVSSLSDKVETPETTLLEEAAQEVEPATETPETISESPVEIPQELATKQEEKEVKSIEQIMEESVKRKAAEEVASNSTTGPTHSLFDSILNPTPPKPETHGLFENILTSES